MPPISKHRGSLGDNAAYHQWGEGTAAFTTQRGGRRLFHTTQVHIQGPGTPTLVSCSVVLARLPHVDVVAAAGLVTGGRTSDDSVLLVCARDGRLSIFLRSHPVIARLPRCNQPLFRASPAATGGPRTDVRCVRAVGTRTHSSSSASSAPQQRPTCLDLEPAQPSSILMP